MMRDLKRFRNNRIAKVLTLLALVAGLLLIIKMLSRMPVNFPIYDFAEYWASGKLTAAGENPFDPQRVLQVQRVVGWEEAEPILCWYPPWANSLFIPFGLMEYSFSRLVWFFAEIFILLYCANRLWRLYGGLASQQRRAALIGLTFAPAVLTLLIGQIPIFLLLGITGFLYLTSLPRQDRVTDFLAGCSLALLSFKPQLLYAFWIALALWILTSRRWMIVIGAAAAVGAGMLISLAFDPGILSQYLRFLGENPPGFWETPTISYYLLLLTDFRWLKLLYLPAILGAAWAVFYWRRNRSAWNWLHTIHWLCLVSLVTTPHGWTYDYTVLLPMIVQGGVWLLRSASPWITRPAALIYWAAGGLYLFLHLKFQEPWFIWTLPFYLALYLLAARLEAHASLIHADEYASQNPAFPS